MGPRERQQFRKMYKSFLRDKVRSTIDWMSSDSGRSLVMPHADVTRYPDDAGVARELLNRLVIVKLNGGLGTSMGLRGPKSALGFAPASPSSTSP